MFFWGVIWLISVIVTTSLGAKKGNPISGFVVGLIFGPIGIIFALLSSDSTRKPCPHCSELIKKNANICPFCKNEVQKTKAE